MSYPTNKELAYMLAKMSDQMRDDGEPLRAEHVRIAAERIENMSKRFQLMHQQTTKEQMTMNEMTTADAAMPAFHPTSYDLENMEALLSDRDRHTHLSAHLFRLIKKMDQQHRARFAVAYPDHVAAVERFEREGPQRASAHIDALYRASIYLGRQLWYRSDRIQLESAVQQAIAVWAHSLKCVAGAVLKIEKCTGFAGYIVEPLWDLALEPTIRQEQSARL